MQMKQNLPWCPFVQDPFIRDPFVRDSNVRNPFVRYPNVRDSFVRDPFVRDPNVWNPFVRDPIVLEPICPVASLSGTHLSAIYLSWCPFVLVLICPRPICPEPKCPKTNWNLFFSSRETKPKLKPVIRVLTYRN